MSACISAMEDDKQDFLFYMEKQIKEKEVAMDKQQAHAHGEQWAVAWNAHNLDAIDAPDIPSFPPSVS